MSLSDNTTMLVQPYNGNNGGLFGNGNNDWWILLLFLWGGYGGYLPLQRRMPWLLQLCD